MPTLIARPTQLEVFALLFGPDPHAVDHDCARWPSFEPCTGPAEWRLVTRGCVPIHLCDGHAKDWSVDRWINVQCDLDHREQPDAPSDPDGDCPGAGCPLHDSWQTR